MSSISVKSLLGPLLKKVASLGQGGDSVLAHLTKGDVVIPREMLSPKVKLAVHAILKGQTSRFVVGNEANKLNTDTGLPEFEDGGDGSGTGGGDGSDGEGDAGSSDGGVGNDAGGSDVGIGGATDNGSGGGGEANLPANTAPPVTAPSSGDIFSPAVDSTGNPIASTDPTEGEDPVVATDNSNSAPGDQIDNSTETVNPLDYLVPLAPGSAPGTAVNVDPAFIDAVSPYDVDLTNILQHSKGPVTNTNPNYLIDNSGFAVPTPDALKDVVNYQQNHQPAHTGFFNTIGAGLENALSSPISGLLTSLSFPLAAANIGGSIASLFGAGGAGTSLSNIAAAGADGGVANIAPAGDTLATEAPSFTGAGATVGSNLVSSFGSKALQLAGTAGQIDNDLFPSTATPSPSVSPYPGITVGNQNRYNGSAATSPSIAAVLSGNPVGMPLTANGNQTVAASPAKGGSAFFPSAVASGDNSGVGVGGDASNTNFGNTDWLGLLQRKNLASASGGQS